MRYNKIVQRFENEGIADIKDFLEQRTSREREKEPFYDKLCQCAGVDFEERHDNIVAVTDQVMTLIYAAMSIPNIWTKPTNVNDLRGKIGTTLRFSGIQQLKENSESIVTELIKLAKSNESVLRKFIINKN